MTLHLTQTVRIGADVGVYSIVAVGWLGLLQPWLTALATIIAIIWTGIKIYEYYKNKKSK